MGDGPRNAQTGSVSPPGAQISVRNAVNNRMAELITRSRAVVRNIDPGNAATCHFCGDPVKFVARAGLHQVIANVYSDGVWDRVEHYHEPCYATAGHPHGRVG